MWDRAGLSRYIADVMKPFVDQYCDVIDSVLALNGDDDDIDCLYRPMMIDKLLRRANSVDKLNAKLPNIANRPRGSTDLQTSVFRSKIERTTSKQKELKQGRIDPATKVQVLLRGKRERTENDGNNGAQTDTKAVEARIR